MPVKDKQARAVIQRRYDDKRRFGGNREKAILRDNESCVNCGMTRADHLIKFGRDIHVDHIDLMGVSKPRSLKNNALDNLQTLCNPCHVAKDARLRQELGITVTNKEQPRRSTGQFTFKKSPPQEGKDIKK